MNLGVYGGLLPNLLRVAVVGLFIAYFALVATKSPFDFSDPAFEGPPAGKTQVQMVIENEPSDHLRTAAASLLLGLLIGNAMLRLASPERRRFALAILVSSSILLLSTFFGLSPLGSQLILLVIGLYGCCFGAHLLWSVNPPQSQDAHR